MKADKERKKALWKVDIELRRQSEEGLEQQEREQSQSLENVVVLDDNIVPVEFNVLFIPYFRLWVVGILVTLVA